ncbi:MAG: FHA domain-containing protein [Porphyromonas sp.]|nr:FHA domain-containing protein [Porphyromonas sp.]
MSEATPQDKATIHCPYCGKETAVGVPAPNAEKALYTPCNICRKPIAVYSSVARTRTHEDRSTKAVTVESFDFSHEPAYLEFIENQFAHPQRLRIPLGTSRVGRYNPHSKVELQLFTNDPSMDRSHLKLQLKEDGTLLASDPGSNTGTYVNRSLLEPREQRRLEDGDIITMGATTAIVHLTEEL